VEIGAIQALIASLKAAADIAKTVFDIKTSTEVKQKIGEIQSALLAAQNAALSATTAQFELQEKVRALEAQLKSVNDWEEQRTRYALVSPWKGAAQAYALKQAHANGDEPHLLCANCFHNSKRVVLNPSNRDSWVVMACPVCRATLETGFRGIGKPVYAEAYQQ
jgi:hypothetical protein